MAFAITCRHRLQATVKESRDALLLSRQRYESGLENFIDVLDAERTLQQNELSLADSGTAVSVDLVTPRARRRLAIRGRPVAGIHHALMSVPPAYDVAAG